MKVDFSFLTSGPTFRCELPDEFDSLPGLSSPVDNGNGGRSFSFVPAFRDDGITEPHDVTDKLMDPQGHQVDLVERLGDPQQWYLRWYLRDGSLYTHLRDTDGVAKAEETLRYVTVDESSGSLPFLLIEPPFRSAVSGHAGYQEQARYFSAAIGNIWVLEFRRPGFLGPGTLMELPGASQTIVRAGTSFGLEIVAITDLSAKKAAEMLMSVVATLREAADAS